MHMSPKYGILVRMRQFLFWYLVLPPVYLLVGLYLKFKKEDLT